MSTINLMSADLANRIAAGEVIDRPSSVVKELVENSIDAGSKNIRISIKRAGKEEIRVQDDGSGMDRIDAELCFIRHASSKLKSTFDLKRITTLGFRGEALPSIASIAHVEMQTYDGTNQAGTRILLAPGTDMIIEDSLKRKGTIFIVRNLFFNTPARLKYLKSDMTETASIIETIETIALGFPNISFELEVDGKENFKTSGLNNLGQTILEIYGLETARNMISVEGSSNLFHVYGMIAKPSINYANRYHQLSFINKRPVYINKVNLATNSAYKDYLPPNRYPLTILFFDIDYSLVDINVHPSKREVRISEEEELSRLVEMTIKRTLLSTKPDYTSISPLPKLQRKAQEEEVFQPTLEEISFTQEIMEKSESIPLVFNDVEQIAPLEILHPSPQEKKETSSSLPLLVPIGQVLKTYIICDGEDGFYLLDQHAAAERINFEAAQKAFASDSIEQVIPLVPPLLELPSSLFSRLDERHIASLKSIGIDVEPFGRNIIRVFSYPQVLADEKDDSLLLDLILSSCKDERADIADLKRLAIATSACKASIKANMFLTMENAQKLIDELAKCKNPANCPHGRPTLIKISKYDIEKMFKRVGL